MFVVVGGLLVQLELELGDELNVVEGRKPELELERLELAMGWFVVSCQMKATWSRRLWQHQ